MIDIIHYEIHKEGDLAFSESLVLWHGPRGGHCPPRTLHPKPMNARSALAYALDHPEEGVLSLHQTPPSQP